jgi:hypothetical protein
VALAGVAVAVAAALSTGVWVVDHQPDRSGQSGLAAAEPDGATGTPAPGSERAGLGRGGPLPSGPPAQPAPVDGTDRLAAGAGAGGGGPAGADPTPQIGSGTPGAAPTGGEPSGAPPTSPEPPDSGSESGSGATSPPPSPAPTPGPVEGTWVTDGGTVTAECAGSTATLLSWVAALPDFTEGAVEAGPGPEVSVVFTSDQTQVSVVVHCEDGAPAAVVS